MIGVEQFHDTAFFYRTLKAGNLIVLPFPHRINYLLTIASLRRRSIGEQFVRLVICDKGKGGDSYFGVIQLELESFLLKQVQDFRRCDIEAPVLGSRRTLVPKVRLARIVPARQIVFEPGM